MSQQAGLGYQPPEQPAAAGLPAAPLTMVDQMRMVEGMLQQGMTLPEVRTNLQAMGVLQPTQPLATDSPSELGLGGVVRQGAQQFIEDSLAGAGIIAERTFGMEGARESAAATGEAIAGLTPEDEAARAARSEDQGFGGQVLDAAAGSLPGVAVGMGGGVLGGVIGSILGGAAGSIFGPLGTVGGAVAGRTAGASIGRAMGATIGGALAYLPSMVQSAITRATENGEDPAAPETQQRAIAVGAARAVLEGFGIERAASILLGPATDIAARSLTRAAAQGAGRYGAIEAAAEVAGEILEIAVFDPEISSMWTQEEWTQLAPYIAERYGEELAVAGAAGALVGSGIGGTASTFDQRRVNAHRQQDIEALQQVAEAGGVDLERLQQAAADPRQVPALANAARELGGVRRELDIARDIMDAATATNDPDAIAQAQDRFTAASRRADETYDRVMQPFGAMTTQQIDARAEQQAQRARDALVGADIVDAATADRLPRAQAVSHADKFRTAQERVENATRALDGADMFDPQRRQAAETELKTAQTVLQNVRDDIAVRTGRDTKDSITKRRQEQKENADYASAVDRQYARKFEPLIAKGQPDAAVAEAQRIVAEAEANPDKGLQTAITKIEKQLDKATSVAEIDRLEAEIAARRKRLDRQAPIVAAARRVLETAEPRQAGASTQGLSPVDARQSAQSPATTAAATPAAVQPPVAAGTATEPGATSAPAAQTAAGAAPTPARAPSAEVTVPPATPEQIAAGAAATSEQVEQAIQRLRAASQNRMIGEPADAAIAADQILEMGRLQREASGADPDASPSDAFGAGATREQLSAERDLAAALGLPFNATPSQMRAALDAARAATGGRAGPSAAAAQARSSAAPAVVPPAGATSTDPSAAPATSETPNKHTSAAPGYEDLMQVLNRKSVTRAQAIRFVQEQAALRKAEVAVAFDPATGEVLGAGTSNLPNEVNLSQEVLDRLYRGETVEIIHNHPSGSSFSNADLAFMYSFPGTARVIAVAPDGAVFRAEPTDLGRKVFGNRAQILLRKLLPQKDTDKTVAQDMLYAILSGYVAEGVISVDANGTVARSDVEAVWRGVSRAISRGMAQEGLMRYTETGLTPRVTSREQNAYDQGVRNVRKTIRNTFSLPTARGASATGSRSGTVQRPGNVRPERSDAASPKGRNRGTSGRGLRADTAPDVSAIDAGQSSAGRSGRYASAATEPLPGAPTIRGATGPDPQLVSVAEAYAAQAGIDLRRQAEFVKVDPERARRIAAAYEAMPHAPDDPAVRAAYEDLIAQTTAQYRALEAAGYQFYFFNPEGADPYADQAGGFGNPWNAMRDLRANQKMAVYPTADGFGTDVEGAASADVSNSPLLAPTGLMWAWGTPDGPLVPVTANDLFRAVHDAFGHGLEGAGFRADGEENAWQAHARLFTGPALAALTSETRGQNSWLNFGPFGETNRTANVENTVFAEQKTGLMPEWTWQEGRAGDMPGALSETQAPPQWTPAPQQIRRGLDISRNFAWMDASQEIGPVADPEVADDFVRRKGGTDVEYTVTTRPDGTVISAGTNNYRFGVVGSEASEYARANNIGPIRVTHNHPFPAALSAADVLNMLASKSPMEIVAVMPNGARNTATRGLAAEGLDKGQLARIIDGADDKVYSSIRLLQLEANRQVAAESEARNRAIERAGLINYTWEGDGPKFPRDIDRMIDNAAEIARERAEQLLASERRASGPAGQQSRTAEPTANVGADAAGQPGSADATGGAETPFGLSQPLTPEQNAIITQAAEKAAADFVAPDPQGRASPAQVNRDYLDQMLRDSGGTPLPPDLAFEADTLRRNREAFKAARPDLHPAVLTPEGEPIVVWHGTGRDSTGFQAFDPDLMAQGTFTSPNRRTSASYASGPQSLTARFRREDVELDQAVTDPMLLERLGVEVEPAGRMLITHDINDAVGRNSMWGGVLFPNGSPNLVPLSNASVQRAVDEGVLTKKQVDNATAYTYYTVNSIDGTELISPREYPGAVAVAETLDRLAARRKKKGVGGTDAGSFRGGNVYPGFIDIKNPFIVDYQGRLWNNPPATSIFARVALPIQNSDTNADANFDLDLDAPQYDVSEMIFDYDTYGGRYQAEAAANEWANSLTQDLGTVVDGDFVQTPSPEFRFSPSVTIRRQSPFPNTDAYAQYARENGYDGIIFQNILDPGPKGGGIDVSDVFVVFEPEQFKHALDNDGTFDADDVNMLSDQQAAPVIERIVKDMKQRDPEIQKMLQVPAWLDVTTQQGSAVADMYARAKEPGAVTRWLKEFERQVVNQMTPIRNAEIQRKGRLGVGMDSAYKAAEVAINDPGRNEQLLYYGAADLGPNGEFRVAANTVGLRTMLQKLGKGQAIIDWMDYMGAKRAQEIRAKGFDTPLTDADIAAGLAKETPIFREVAADWKRHNDANVDFLVKTGRISPMLAATLKADAAYVPFYRSDATVGDAPDLADDMAIRERATISRRGGDILARDPGLKKLVGGKTRKVNNIIENMVRNSQAMAAAGMRNRAANLTFDMLLETGDVTLSPARVETKDGNWVQKTMPENSVRMWKHGKESYVTPTSADAVPVIIAMAGLQPERLGGIHGVMAAVGSFFRQSITLSPAFIVRNMIRDAISTGVLFGGRNLTMERNMFKGFRDSLRYSASRQAFTAMSGMGDFRFGGADIGLGKDDLLIEFGVMNPTTMGKMGFKFRQFVGLMEQVGTASELSNRLAVYEALINEGVRPDEAAYQALTLVNYSRRGANEQLRVLLPLVPFLNARIQGLARMGEDVVARRGADRKQALAKLALSGSLLTLASALLWGWNNQDEERREEYLSEPLHRRLNYHIFYVGDRRVMIPKAFEIGTIFSTIPEMFMEAAVMGETSELGSAAVMTLTNTFGFNPIPQAVLPALELAANYNFFTGAPVEGARLSSLVREDRINPQTSAMAVGLARSGLGSFTGLSPVAIDHLLAGYGGVAYTSLTTMVDTVAGEMGLLPERPEGVFGSVPVVSPVLENTFRSMFRNRDADPVNRWVEDFYTTRTAVQQVYRSARAAALSGDVERARQLLALAPEAPAANSLVNRAGVRLGEISSEIRRVQTDPDMSAQDKGRRMETLVRERNRIATQVMQVIRELEDQQGTSFRRAAS